MRKGFETVGYRSWFMQRVLDTHLRYYMTDRRGRNILCDYAKQFRLGALIFFPSMQKGRNSFKLRRK